MGETRGGKYGRNLAIWVNETISFHETKNKFYRDRFLLELRAYSFEPRKEGYPKNSGCVHELSGIDAVNMDSPKEFARLVKEGFHMMYQKRTSQKSFNALWECLIKYLE